ncbi:helix-turn-helix domain-containing protein [Glutamicibacter sp. NPDC087344]|uniref:AlbA family DNA-binding domain-containing protein n=1 Tax=Glutamicibacter sp. NPDC087344 TaxID=3363994 RepID=UPI0037F87D7D
MTEEEAPDFQAQPQPFACDGRINEEKLFELLAAGGEFQSLDFKRELDLGDARKNLDFVKDCAAMMNLPEGGYLVIGATDDGTPAIDVTSPTKEMFDSAKLTQAVGSYVDCSVDIRSQVHTVLIDATPAIIAVIYVAPPADGLPAIISKNGILTLNGRQKVHLPQGTIFTREGSSNVTVRHKTWHQVLSNLLARTKAEARADVDALVHRVVQLTNSSHPAQPVALDLDMDSGTFTDSVRAALDSGQQNQIRRFLIKMKTTYQELDQDDEAQIHVVDRIALVACEGIQTKNLEVVIEATDALYEIYKSHLLIPTRTEGPKESTSRWLEIIKRVLAVGSMAVRVGMLSAIPTLTLRKIGDEIYSNQSWIRHAHMSASRAGYLATSNGRSQGGALLAMSLDLIANSPAHRPDLPESLSKEILDETVLDSLCQFDLLWCCVSLANSKDKTYSSFFPSCAAYHQHRAMPIIDKLDSDEGARRDAFGDTADGNVATSIVQVLTAAERQSDTFGGFWVGARRLSPGGFIRSNASAMMNEVY